MLWLPLRDGAVIETVFEVGYPYPFDVMIVLKSNVVPGRHAFRSTFLCSSKWVPLTGGFITLPVSQGRSCIFGCLPHLVAAVFGFFTSAHAHQIEALRVDGGKRYAIF